MAIPEPHWSTSALVVIDVQNDFLDGGAMPVPGPSEIVGPLAGLADSFRAAGRPIVHVVRQYRADGSNVDLVRRHAVATGLGMVTPGSEGSQIPADVTGGAVTLDADLLLGGGFQSVRDDEVVMYKPRWSALHETGLAAWLAERGVDTVVVVGCNLPNCPRATLYDATSLDLRAVLVCDATSGSTQARLDDLELIGVRAFTVAQLGAAMAG